MRRRALVLRSDALRWRIGEEARQGLRLPLAIGGAVWAGWRWVKSHPWVPVAATAVLVAGRKRRTVRLVWSIVWRGLSAWKLWRRWGPGMLRQRG